MPPLGMLSINALTAADRVLIPVQRHYLPAKGLEQLLKTVSKVRRQHNPKLKIDGILLTVVDNRTIYAKEITPRKSKPCSAVPMARRLWRLEQRFSVCCSY